MLAVWAISYEITIYRIEAMRRVVDLTCGCIQVVVLFIGGDSAMLLHRADVTCGCYKVDLRFIWQ